MTFACANPREFMAIVIPSSIPAAARRPLHCRRHDANQRLDSGNFSRRPFEAQFFERHGAAVGRCAYGRGTRWVCRSR
jgi:hypothetical protein